MGAKRQLTGAALTAKVIKQRLTALYPRVKFSVVSDTFSMGDSVDIRWTDGPTKNAVEAITGQYKQGSFDGMTDSYNYRMVDSSLGCKGAKYVHCHRTMSPELKAKIATKADEQFGKLDPKDHSYYRRLAEVEREFFSYPEAVPGQRGRRGHMASVDGSQMKSQGNTIISGLDYDIIKDVDTRDNRDIFVVKAITRVDDFSALRAEMKALGGYYSRFKRGFIFEEDPAALLRGALDDAEGDDDAISRVRADTGNRTLARADVVEYDYAKAGGDTDTTTRKEKIA